jgi:hypothetical protein
MSDELMRAVADLAERLVSLAAQDDGLREGLRTLARAVLAATEGSPSIPALEAGRHAASGDEQGETGLGLPGTAIEDRPVEAAADTAPPPQAAQ